MKPLVRTEYYPKRVLFLTKDSDLVRKQLQGFLDGTPADIRMFSREPLYDRISTDHIIAVPDLLTDDPHAIGDRTLCGMPAEFGFQTRSLKSIAVDTIVAGHAFGMGSSREQAVSGLLDCGVRAVIAPSFGPIFEKNAVYLGLLTTTAMQSLDALIEKNPLPMTWFYDDKDRLSQTIIKSGTLFSFLSEPKTVQQKTRATRPLNVFEKRLFRAAGVLSAPIGSSVPIPIDAAYIYIPVSEPIRELFHEKNLRTSLEPNRIYFFEDHFAYATSTPIKRLTALQRQFAQTLNVPKKNYFFGTRSDGGGLGICHRVMMEKINPLNVKTIIATDSHTPTLGVLPILAIPVGSTLCAAGITYGKIPVSVGRVARIMLTGTLPPCMTIRDAQFEMASRITLPPQTSIVQFGGSGLQSLSVDQAAALCNMVPEIFLADIAVTEPFDAGIEGLVNRFRVTSAQAEALYDLPDRNASYSETFSYNLSHASPWIARPGNPQNVCPLSSLTSYPTIQKAFLASCTNGLQEIREAAAVLSGLVINKAVQFIVIPSSLSVYRQAKELGYIDELKQAGATVIPESACSVCIGNGPYAVVSGETAISATNRNFPGRMGHPQGKVYLAGSILVAISALYGKIPTGEEVANEQKRITSFLKDTTGFSV